MSLGVPERLGAVWDKGSEEFRALEGLYNGDLPMEDSSTAVRDS